MTRVIDGDTVEVEFQNGETDTIRLIGVDTPETTLSDVSPDEYEGIPSTSAARDHLYNWGQRASEFATEQLAGQQVRVVTDAEGDRRGSFGRLLAYIYTDGQNFNRQLLEEGYARLYDSEFSLRNKFESAEIRLSRTTSDCGTSRPRRRPRPHRPTRATAAIVSSHRRRATTATSPTPTTAGTSNRRMSLRTCSRARPVTLRTSTPTATARPASRFNLVSVPPSGRRSA